MKKIVFVLSLMLAALACNKVDIKEDAGEGILNLTVDIASSTKAALSSDELLNTAVIKVYKANYKGLVRSYTYSSLPSPFYLATDRYRVDVRAGECVKEEPSAASWDQKSYLGSTEFEIRKNNIENVAVEAFVTNAVTKITFDQTIVDNFEEGYAFSIGLDADSQLVYDSSRSGAEGYFIIDDIKNPSFSWTFTGTLLKDGSTFTKTGVIDDIASGKVYKMNLKYTIKDGDLDFALMVDYNSEIVDNTIVFDPVVTGLVPSSPFEIWARHAVVHANVDAKQNPDAIVQFGYSSDGSVWAYADAAQNEDGSYSASLAGLNPVTDYSYCLVVNGEHIGDPRSFTTESAPALPNASFEHVSLVYDKSANKTLDFYKFYDPECGVEDATKKFWASGNGDEESVKGIGYPGSFADSGKGITVPDETEKVHGDRSVRAQSVSVMGSKLAAGNLFTGQFVQTEGMSGGTVNFGRPFEARPTALRFWAKYTTGKMDFSGTADGIKFTGSDYDRAQIKIALGTWSPDKYKGTDESPVKVNTTMTSTFVDFYNDTKGGTVANGDIIIYRDGYDLNRNGWAESTTSEWKEYIIPINYQKSNVYPTHIIISCSASQYGDYFVGSSSSRLWLDDFELIYE